MEDNLVDELCPEIREALFDVAESLLNTPSFKLRVDKGSKKGTMEYFWRSGHQMKSTRLY